PDFTTYYYVNPAYESIFGQSIDEALQDPRSFLRAIHPLDPERVASALEGEYSPGDYDASCRVVHPSGTVRWVRARAYPVRDAQGKIVRVAGIAEDITERKEVEEEREKLLERERSALTETQTALQLRDRVLRTVSHDLKDPLHTIAMAADVL